jgi:tRNA-dihydrouridine synthase B
MDFKLFLAPIEAMTDNAFRTLCYRHGADMTLTEMAKIEALADNNSNTLKKIELLDDTPTVIQLIGNKEDKLEIFLKNFKKSQGFSGFNLNLGCPNPDVVRVGQGCAMIKRVSKVQRMITILKSKGYPVSIKLRLGMNEYEKEKKAYLTLIKETDADFYIVHARHGKQIYSEPADFSVYENCVKTGKEIIANGDIKTYEQIDYLKSIGLSGAMIGRAAIEDPQVFAKIKGLPIVSVDELKKEYMELAEKYEITNKYKNNILRRLKY